MATGPFYYGEVVPPEYTALVQPHVDSFDYFVDEGMDMAVSCMEPIEVHTHVSTALTVHNKWLINILFLF
jgi:DNA-directed RNA polymerase I subunit RPA2